MSVEQSVQEWIEKFPRTNEYNDELAWVTAVLGLFPFDTEQVDTDEQYPQIQLPELEAALYRELVHLYGEAKILDSGTPQRRPNPALLFEWELMEKYGFGLRYYIEITEQNILRYMGKNE